MRVPLLLGLLGVTFALPKLHDPRDLLVGLPPPTGDETVLEMLRDIGHNPDVFENAALRITNEQHKEILRRAALQVEQQVGDFTPKLQVACTVCEILVSTLQSALEAAAFDPDTAWIALRPTAEALCIDVLNVAGLNAEAMCPGLMGAYVPHLLYIFANKTMTPEYVCSELNFCTDEAAVDFEDVPVYVKDNETPMERFDDVSRQKRQSTNIFRVALITDVHVDHGYTVGAPTDCNMIICCRPGDDYSGSGAAGRYGSYSCNIPMRTVELFMSQIANMEPKPDIILYGGDAPPHALWEETFEGQMQASQALTEAFRRNLPNTRIFPTIGNHESYPGNLYYQPRWETQEMNRRFTEWWRDLANFTDENVRTWRENGYYTDLIRPGLRILAYNSNYGYNLNFYNLLNVDRPEFAQLRQFMTNTLSAARQNNEKVIMLGHHPTGSAQVHWGRFYTDLVVQYGDIITFQTCGHTHRDHFEMFVDQAGNARGQMFVSPSVTTFGRINPSARIFSLDTDNNLVDYDQYYLDITTADQNPEIRYAYSARSEYSLEDMSPFSWLQLTQRFETNQTLFNRYYWHKNTRSSDIECDAECKAQEICQMRNSRFDLRSRCIDNIPEPEI